MTKWTKAVPDNELDTAFFNNYFISLTEKECNVLKFKILQFCHVLSKHPVKYKVGAVYGDVCDA